MANDLIQLNEAYNSKIELSRSEQIEKIAFLRQEEALKILFMWVKQGVVTYKEFRYILERYVSGIRFEY